MTRSISLSALADTLRSSLQAEIIGDSSLVVSRLAHPAERSGKGDLILAMDKALLPLLHGVLDAPVVVTADGVKALHEMGVSAPALLVVARGRYAMARLNAVFEETLQIERGVHPLAVVEPSAVLGKDVSIAPFVYVGARAVIGDGCVLHPHVYVGQDASLGAGALVHSGVKIGARVVIGDRFIAHFNASVGADGFSFVTPQMGSVEAAKATGSVGASNHELVRIASLGSVIIGDDVEIGANTSIDRGTIISTKIGDGTKIDNQVQVGHNVSIGKNCMLCGRVGIAGSVEIGDRVVLGGASGIADHIRVGSDSIVMGMSGVTGHLAPRSLVGGLPAKPRQKWIEDQFSLSRMKSLMRKVKDMALRVEALEKGEVFAPSPNQSDNSDE